MLNLKSIKGINKQFFKWVIETPADGWIKTYNSTDYYMIQEDDTLYIKFQQTDGARDWERNLWFFPKPIVRHCYKEGVLEWLRSIWFSHEGFYLGWQSCYRDILMYICDHNEIKKIVFVGYSQGAGIALEGYKDFKNNFDSVKVECYAFAPPRIVFFLFAWNIWKFLKDAHLVMARGDLVTCNPPWFFGFLHIGKKHKFGRWQPWSTIACHEPFYYEDILPDASKGE